MSFHLIHFSKNMQGYCDVNLYLPVGTEYEDMVEPGEKFQTLWILHGGHGNFMEWPMYSAVEKLAMLNKFAVVSVKGDTGFYNDGPMGKNYYTYIVDELPAFLRKHFPLSDKREDNFICGLSMGGFGACQLGFTNPDKYCAVGAFSCGPADPLVEFTRKDNRMADQFKYIFKEGDLAPGTPLDIWGNFLRLKDSGGPMPLFYDAVGRQDRLYLCMQDFQRFCEEHDLTDYVIFDVLEGVHCWDVWDECVHRFVDLLPLRDKGIWRKWYNERHPEAR